MGKRITVGRRGSTNGNFVRWSEVPSGTTFEGTWEGPRKGRFGPLGDLQTANGTLTFGLPVALKERLGALRPGARGVCITYLGQEPIGDTGRSVHTFDVIADEEDLLEAAPDDA